MVHDEGTLEEFVARRPDTSGPAHRPKLLTGSQYLSSRDAPRLGTNGLVYSAANRSRVAANRRHLRFYLGGMRECAVDFAELLECFQVAAFTGNSRHYAIRTNGSRDIERPASIPVSCLPVS